jgi:hypothetical protein
LLKWTAAVVVVCLLAGGGYLYFRASRVPEAYRYRPLSRAERKQSATDFYNQLARFNRHAQDTQPFRFSISEDRINRYLASMEEIAAIRPGHRSGSVVEALHEAGVADPAVALEDGRLRLMLRLREYHKIISLTLGIEFTADRKLRVKLIETAVGTLAVPDDLVRQRLTALRESLAKRATDEPTDEPSDPTGQVVDVLRAVLQAIDREPITPVGTWDQRRIRVHNVTIAPGKLTLHVHRAPKSPDDGR